MSQNESFRVAGSPQVSQPCGFAALVSKWLTSMARQPTPSAFDPNSVDAKSSNFWDGFIKRKAVVAPREVKDAGQLLYPQPASAS